MQQANHLISSGPFTHTTGASTPGGRESEREGERERERKREMEMVMEREGEGEREARQNVVIHLPTCTIDARIAMIST